MPRHHKNIRYEIIREADKRFRKYGIKAVTMDDIARGIGISKRTLYETYPNKEVVLMGVLTNIMEERDDLLQEVMSKTDNVMDILCEVLRLQIEFSAATHSAFFSDMAKYPTIEKMLAEFNISQREKAYNFYMKGVAQGYFRRDIDYKIFNRITTGIMRMLRSTNEFNDLSFQQLFVNCHSVIIRGVCTKKGIERFERFMIENFEN
jgi:AcrR family transcriptional regulator